MHLQLSVFFQSFRLEEETYLVSALQEILILVLLQSYRVKYLSFRLRWQLIREFLPGAPEFLDLLRPKEVLQDDVAILLKLLITRSA